MTTEINNEVELSFNKAKEYALEKGLSQKLAEKFSNVMQVDLYLHGWLFDDLIEIQTEEQLEFAVNAKQAILQANLKEKQYSDTLKSNPGNTIKKCVEHEIPSKYCYFGKHQVSSETQLLDLLRTDIFETVIECDLFTHMLTSKVALAPRGDYNGITKNMYWCKNELKDYYINECKSDPKDCGIPNYMSLNTWEQLIGTYESKHDDGADMVLL